ncbi:MAG TPA: MFS transporter, partial [Anaerolineaceae bacterium]|nr:MFS transporter [Anaerolineaceae bacterium]
METAHSRPQSLWKNADFLKFWCGQTISEIGSHITRDGLPLLAVLTLGATPLQMGLLSAAGSLPVLLVSLHAGVWVDRLRRRPVMMAADAGLALALLTVPLAHFLGVLRIEQLYLVAMLTGVLAVIFDLAYHAYLPSLVERDHLVEGNSKMAFSESVAELAGSSLAGILVQLLTAPVAILVDSLSFLASLLGIEAPGLSAPTVV